MFRIGKKYIISSAILVLIMIFILYGINEVSSYYYGDIKELGFFGSIVSSLPYFVLAIMLFTVSILEIFIFIKAIKRRKNILTKRAIKESLDFLPDGVCFYAEDGQPLLINEKMHYISGELFDFDILNAKKFQANLLNNNVKKGVKIIRTEPTIIVETLDGSVWDFRFNRLNIEKSEYYELIAYDISKQYRLNEKLKKLNDSLNIINDRLKEFRNNMAQLISEKELLNAKVDVHNSIGRFLLACRNYLSEDKEKRNRNNLLFLWNYVFMVMNNEPVSLNEWDVLKKTADSLGIEIKISGVMPKNLKIKNLILGAIKECLTNTSNHAKGDKLFVNIFDNENMITVEITNTGIPPKGEIKEKGGLKNLRHIVEEVNAVMTIETKPNFLLRIEFQKGEEEKWLKQKYWL
ncbi:MAG: hypothetical protein ACI4VF_09825 [Lachnospirales bacterium]